VRPRRGEAVRGGGGALRHEQRVALAVGGLPVGAAGVRQVDERAAPELERDEVDAEQRPRAHHLAQSGVELGGADVPERNRRLVEGGAAERGRGCVRLHAAELETQAGADGDEAAGRGRRDAERPGNPARCGGDRGQRVREMPPRPAEDDPQLVAARLDPLRVGEEPGGRRPGHGGHAPQLGGDRLRVAAMQRPGAEALPAPRRAEARPEMVVRPDAERRRVERAGELDLVAALGERGVERPAQVRECDPDDVRRAVAERRQPGGA